MGGPAGSAPPPRPGPPARGGGRPATGPAPAAGRPVGGGHPARSDPPRPDPRSGGAGRWVLLGAVGVIVALAAVLGYRYLGPSAADDRPLAPAGTAAPTAATTPVVVGPPLPAAARPLPDDVIVWPQRRGDNWDIATITSAGVTGPPLIAGPEEDTLPIISPDRRTVVYLHTTSPGIREVRVMGADGSGDRPLFDPVPDGCRNVTRPAFSDQPEPRVVLPCVDPVTGDVTLMLLRLDGTVVRELDRGRLSDPALTPDGASCLYWQDNATRGEGGAIYRVPLDGSAPPTPITAGGAVRDNDAAVSPRGDLVAITRAGQGIWTIELDAGHRPTQLTSDPTDQDPSWSPDAAQIVFKRQDQIWLMNADGSGVRRLSADGEIGTAAAWSPR